MGVHFVMFNSYRPIAILVMTNSVFRRIENAVKITAYIKLEKMRNQGVIDQ